MHTYIIKQIKRSAVSNAAFCLLLALAGALLALGAGLLLSALGNEREIDEHFTTIALPDTAAIHRFALIQAAEDQDIQEHDMGMSMGMGMGRWIITRDDPSWGGQLFEQLVASEMQERTLANIEAVVYHSGAVDMDPRRYFGAFSPDIIAMYGAEGGMRTSGDAGGSAAFVARVTNITESRVTGVPTDPDTGEEHSVSNVHAYVDFEIEETLILHPNIAEPARLFIRMYLQDEHGGYFFTVGGRYLISGNYVQGMNRSDRNTFMPYLRMGFPMDVTAMRSTGYAGYETNTYFFALGGMTFEEALYSGAGDAIAYALRATEMDTHRLNILTTGNLYSKFPFNQHQATITEGRSFTREEYESGARLAIVPAPLARRNDLTVGDVIILTFFEGQFEYVLSFTWDGASVPRTHRRWDPGGFIRGMHTAEPIDFEIIGIYTAPTPRAADPHSIPRNTIIIPDNAFAGFYEPAGEPLTLMLSDDRAESPLLNVIVVPNGHNEEFRQTINALIPGYGAFFRLYDQGYSVVRNALDNLLRNGWFIFVLCLAGWLVAAIVFCLFFILRKRKEAGLLYALGISGKSRFRWIFAQCVIVIIIAQGIAFGAATVLYERIFDNAVETAVAAVPVEPTLFGDAAVVEDGVQNTMEFVSSPLAVPLATAASMVLLLLATTGIAHGITKNNPRALRGAEV